jgi:hypothetical protein
MASMDVFKGDAFSTFELTQALNNVPSLPNYLDSLNIFEPMPVRTEHVAIESRDNVLTLVQTSERGTPYASRTDQKRALRYFPTVRVANKDRLNASEIQNIRAFGSDSELMQMQEEVLRKFTNLRNDQELTHEHLRLGAVQGIVLDADGSTIRDWYAEWGVSQPAEIDFNLDATSGAAIRTACDGVVRAMARASKGAWIDNRTYAVGLASDTFWDALIAAPETRATYLNQQEAADLRTGTAYQTFKYGNIIFVNYRGTDDGDSTQANSVNVPVDKCKFFPVNAPGVFKKAQSPGESFDYVNTPGQPYYARQVLDDEDNAYVDLKLASYSLYVCTKPLMLQRARLT